MYCIFLAVVILTNVAYSWCENCSDIYLRYSNEHTFCAPKNMECSISYSGVTPENIQEILDSHNEYRNYVATGKEKQAGSLPKAADMLLMVWDEELADLSQKLADNCTFEHDCPDCREVQNFRVGQNLGFQEQGGVNADNESREGTPKWSTILKMFYDEVGQFNKTYVNSHTKQEQPVIGHFTQMIWSKSWRIGCGYVEYDSESRKNKLYVCNYGPGGNIENEPIYQEGEPCSSCPENSCCGESCENSTYDGLCQMDDDNEAPIYLSGENSSFYCDFTKKDDDDCQFSACRHKWKHIKALGGSYMEIVLNGGRNSTMTFNNTLETTNDTCLRVMYRTGVNKAGQQVANSAVLNLETMKMTLASDTNNKFQSLRIDLKGARNKRNQISVAFSVPEAAPAQFLNIKSVTAENGRCD